MEASEIRNSNTAKIHGISSYKSINKIIGYFIGILIKWLKTKVRISKGAIKKMLEVYDRFNKNKIYVELLNKSDKDLDLFPGMILKNNRGLYSIIGIKYKSNSNTEIEVEPYDEYLKKSIMVKLNFNYVTLKEVENTLKQYYGFILKRKCMKKI